MSNLTTASSLYLQLFKRRNVEMINEEAAMFDSLLMDSYVSSTTGVRKALASGGPGKYLLLQNRNGAVHII